MWAERALLIGLMFRTGPQSVSVQSFQHIVPLLFKEIQDVDEDPVFRKLVAVPPVDIDDAHLGPWPCGQAHVAACGCHRQVRPAEKPTVVAFGKPCDVSVELAVCKLGSEGALVLVDITVDGVGRPNPVWSPPDHVVVPAV